MEDKLAILETTIPLRSIPDVKDVLEDVLCSVINDLLSLKGDSAKKLYQAVPAIKKHCWSMGFKEVVKMFTMYADGELSLEPRSNYFDRVLVGHIYNAYKWQKRTKPEVKDLDKEKEIRDFLYTVQLFDYFVQENHIPKLSIWVYTYLTKTKNLVICTEEEKRIAYNKALKLSKNKTQAIEASKLILVNKYFSTLQAKGQHIKDLL